MKRKINLTEGELHRLIKESVKQVLNEAYSDAQYAHLAGQAHGALNSFGGKVKGIFNPNWKKKKEKQRDRFAKQATGSGLLSNDIHRNKKSRNSDGNVTANVIGYSGKGPTYNYYKSEFNKKNKETPFEIQNHAFHIDKDGKYHSLNGDRTAVPRKYIRDKRDEYFKDGAIVRDLSNKYDNLANSNQTLNTAFRDGVASVKRKGEIKKTRGGNFKFDTGTNSDTFKYWK